MKVARASGKIILFGEHAVVYGRPAIAVPVTEVQARASVEAGEKRQGIVIVASDLGCVTKVREGETEEATGPLRAIVASTLDYLGLRPEQALTITVESTIPIARGLGSGAAVSTAIARALAGYFSRELSAEEVSGLVYEVEKLHHGTPSGIDNTVIAYERPVYFIRGQVLETFQVEKPLLFIIADTGVESSTKAVVSAVRQAWSKSRDRYETLFERVGEIVARARGAIEEGEVQQVGRLMDQNQRLLELMGVSSRPLDSLVKAARRAGALGAKLSGAGRGGNIIALVTPDSCRRVSDALLEQGAAGVIHTEVQAGRDFRTSPAPSLVPGIEQ